MKTTFCFLSTALFIFFVIAAGLGCLEHDRVGSYEHEVYLQLTCLNTTCADFVTFHNFL
jgi:hypothetical protein